MNKTEYANMHRLETNFWWYKTLHKLVESFIQPFDTINSSIIFDAGCGTGRMLEISENYAQTEGIDYSEEAIDFAKSRGLKNVFVADLNSYHFEQEKYSVILSLDVLYHEGIVDDVAVLTNFHEALQNGGKLILNLPAFESLRRAHDQVVHTKRRYRKSELIHELKKIGYTIERASYRMPLIYLVIKAQKIFNSRPKEIKSDLEELPSWMNSLLYFMGCIENTLIRIGITIPFGSSLFVVAKK